MSILKKIASMVIDAVFPPRKEQSLIASLTLEDIKNKARPLVLGRELPHSLILFEYKNEPIRTLLLELKTYGDRKACSLLAEAIHDRLAEELADARIMQGFTSPLLIPIPVSKKTLHSRGWNQCELLARELEKIDGKVNFEIDCNALTKTRHTQDQVGKSKAERQTNLQGCFAVQKPERISKRNIILLDDIITTGATMNEAERTLIKAGAKKIMLLAVAH